MNGPVVLVVFAAGLLVGLWLRGQWRGRRTRLVPLPLPFPVVRIVRPINAPAPAQGERAAPKVDLGWVRTAVYLYFGHHDELLYVGIAADPGKRARQHAGLEREDMKPWWPDVHCVEAWWFHDRYVALGVEWALIKYLRPLNNRAPGGPDDAYCYDRPDIEPARFPLPSRTEVRAKRLLRRAG